MTKSLKNLSDEQIFSEIANFIMDKSSIYFEKDIKISNSEMIYWIFSSLDDEVIKNQMRNAIYQCLERRKSVLKSYSSYMDILSLVEVMDVTSSKGIIYRMCFEDTYPNLTAKESDLVKRKCIYLVSIFDLPDDAQKEVINRHLNNPVFTSGCVGIVWGLTSPTESLSEYLASALKILSKEGEIGTLAVPFLDIIERIGWRESERILNIFFSDNKPLLKPLLELLNNAGFNPSSSPFIDNERIVDLDLQWPFRDASSISCIIDGLNNEELSFIYSINEPPGKDKNAPPEFLYSSTLLIEQDNNLEASSQNLGIEYKWEPAMGGDGFIDR